MQKIVCPNCGKEFDIDEKGYAAIAKQVRDIEFSKELEMIRNHIIEEKKNEIRELEEKHKDDLKRMEEVIERYKELKIRMDNKSLGESLEQYCLHKFEDIRGLLSSNVVFEKDNNAKQGETKGDFIFREIDEDGTEILSIMFEMKTEFDDSTNKKKNSDHFGKLDKDRAGKNCEYAVLVTTLEPDNDYYNNGIVKAPGAYSKMYVVRPQCFLTIISILRNAAMTSLESRRTIERMKQEMADISCFEENLDGFKSDFLQSVVDAANNYNKAIDEIDKIIASLVKVRDEYLIKSGKKLNSAAKKVDQITIRKLTKNAPAVQAMFKEAGKKNGMT